MNILLLGPPGAGKGTQGDRLAERLGLRKLATGDVLRTAVRDGTPRGREAKAFMDRGDLVPDDVILGIVKEELAQPAYAQGVILDGVVRTVPQAAGMERALHELGRSMDAVLLFEVDEEELVRRLGSRTVCDRCQTPFTGREAGSACERCGGTLVRRRDDEPEAIRNRMRTYREQTEPVVRWYQERAVHGGPRVIHVDAIGPVDEITERVLGALQAAA